MALVALPAAAIFVLGYTRRHVTDDALIYARTVRQILAGNGPVFNVGERAEASTSSLWQWLLALAGWATRTNVEQLAVFGGLLLTTAGFVVALVATRRFQRERLARNCTLIPGGILLLLALPPVWDYATTGLESGLQTFWLASCWWLLVCSHPTDRLRPGIASLVAIGLGPLVRPELSLVSLVFVVAILVNLRTSLKVGIFGILLASLPAIGYEIFRAGYYGLLVPLPALAKEAAVADLSRGSAYLWDFVEPYWLAVPLLAVGVLLVLGTLPHSRAGNRRSSRSDIVTVTSPVLSAVALTAYVTSIGGDYMHARMLLGPLFLLLMPVLIIPAFKLNLALATAITLWAVLALSSLRFPFDGGGTTAGIDTRNIRLEGETWTKRANPTTATDWLNGFTWLPVAIDRAARAPGPVLAYGPEDSVLAAARADIGARVSMTGGFLGVTGGAAPLDYRIVDMFGLAYPLGGHLELIKRTELPGHEKLLSVVWLFADYADPSARAEGRLPATTLQASIAAGRRALNCGELRELQESVREPMSWSRFHKNLAGSLRRTQLRIPLDPFAAEKQFCHEPIDARWP